MLTGNVFGARIGAVAAGNSVDLEDFGSFVGAVAPWEFSLPRGFWEFC